ncbi:MAG: serine/threonine transporter SstT [Clostridia bacterium]|nr:serine/threonine transporter SstT [Clostridia bacterium]
MKNIFNKLKNTSLIMRIVAGLTVGIVLGIVWPGNSFINLLGQVFLGALKSIAPILVFVLVISSLTNAKGGIGKRFRTVILLYLLSTLLAAFIAVIASRIFPVTLMLSGNIVQVEAVPAGIGEILNNLVLSMVSNPVEALAQGNYMGILTWSVIFGIALKHTASDATKQVFQHISDAVALAVKWIINCAPLGIMGTVYSSVSQSGVGIFANYGRLLALIAGCIVVFVLVIEPLIVAVCLKMNPYPLVFRCLKSSAVTAFFTRSSAANIPINMALCEKLGLDRDMYSVSIPLGSTINMDGAAITITIMALAVANTVGIHVDFPTSLILCVVAAFGACGSSGVAGGSLMLIPMACSLFGVGSDIAMQAVGVGFIIGVLQDSLETAVNSSGDVLFTATAEFMEWKKQGREIKF